LPRRISNRFEGPLCDSAGALALAEGISFSMVALMPECAAGLCKAMRIAARNLKISQAQRLASSLGAHWTCMHHRVRARSVTFGASGLTSNAQTLCLFSSVVLSMGVLFSYDTI
jgi:hypothetical protein